MRILYEMHVNNYIHIATEISAIYICDTWNIHLNFVNVILVQILILSEYLMLMIIICFPNKLCFEFYVNEV